MDDYNLEIKVGKKYSICSCGLSESLPFCDNAHREYNFKNSTQYKSVKLFQDKGKSIVLKCSNWKISPK